MEKKDLLFFTGIIVILILCGVILTIMKMEVTQCLKNPYVYGASHMGNVECSCQQNNNPRCPANFFFNDTSFKNPPTICENTKGLITKVDWDALNFTG